MGTNDEGEQDERPAHSVTVSAFLLDRTEVTQAAYAECVHAGACKVPDALASSGLVYGHPEAFRTADKPVVGVSWFDASDYCAFRGRRLPREAEWERAARGDDARHYVWGNEAPDPKRYGVFGGRLCTEVVGSYPAGRGPYGHLDLAGNAWEWVADQYDPYAYRRASAEQGVPGSCEEILQTLASLRHQHLQGFTGKNPIPVECERVLRGGAYNYGVSGLRASNRVHHPASFRIAVAGFRCAADPQSAKTDISAPPPE
jgi:formylglycine-generating enzyme required for sulfatase activity